MQKFDTVCKKNKGKGNALPEQVLFLQKKFIRLRIFWGNVKSAKKSHEKYFIEHLFETLVRMAV